MSYTLYTNAVLEKDGFYVPIGDDFPEYQEYLAWVALGNSPTIQDASIYFAKLDDDELTRNLVKLEYVDTLAQLQDIENSPNPGVVNLQVILQMVSAIKFIARTLRFVIKLIVKLYI